MHKPKYIWEKKTDQELLFWPDDSCEHYITEAFVPAEAINSNSGKTLVSYPTHESDGFFKRNGILSACFTSHKKGFYQQRANADFHVLLYTTSGSATIAFSGKKVKVKKGDVFVCSAGGEYSISCKSSDWELFWFHLEKKEIWNKLLQQTQKVGKSANFQKLFQLINLYSQELKNKDISVVILESYATIIAELLRREFSFVVSAQADRVLKVVAQMRSSCDKKWTSALASKKARVSVKILNATCFEYYSESFSKLLLRSRMQKATTFLKSKSIAKTAKLVGYSDRFAFSKAFKAFFGKTPVGFL